jgi:hypothetical protein
MTTTHWSPPDIRGDILAVALLAGAAEPVVVHVRPEVHARIGPGPLCPDPTVRDQRAATGRPISIPLVVDDQLPRTPGYEVHRVAPPEPGLPRPTPRRAGGVSPGTRDPDPAVPPQCTGRWWARGDGGRSRSRVVRRLRAHRLHHG